MFIGRSAGQNSDLLNSLENGTLQMRQRQGTDMLLADYLSRTVTKVYEDTIYAYLYRPGSCPRCEYSIKSLRKELNKRGKKLTLITVLEDKEAAKFYNNNKGYGADYYLYDTNNAYDKIFSFNNFSLDGSYVFKATTKGRLISATDNATMSDAFVNAFIARTTPLDYKTFGNGSSYGELQDAFEMYKSLKPLSNCYTDIPLLMPDTVQLALMAHMPTYQDSLFFYADQLLSGTMLFEEDNHGGLLFRQLMKPTQAERLQFIKIDTTVYNHANSLGMFFDIVINASMLDKRHIGMSYSLPSLFYENDGGIAYYNEACILSREVDGLTVGSSTDFDFMLDTSEYFYKHFQFSSTGDKIVLGCQKLTWPMMYEPEQYKGNPDLDPFMDSFYDRDNPYMAVFDRRSGKFIKRFGSLSDVARKSRTGYAFVSPISNVSGAELAYSDGCSGYVCVADTASMEIEKACYHVFDPCMGRTLAVDSASFYSYDYAKPFYRLLYRTISDIRLTSKNVYCLLTYSFAPNGGVGKESHSFVTVDRGNRKVSEYAFPHHDDCYVFGCGLRTIGHDKVLPYEILKRDGQAWLRVYGE